MKLKRLLFARVHSRFGADALLDGSLRDMFRYDTAFQCALDPALAAFPVFRTPGGDLGGRVTERRWHSFGATLTTITNPVECASLRFTMRAPEWHTWQHLPPDYATLVAFTLDDYLKARDTIALTRARE